MTIDCLAAHPCSIRISGLRWNGKFASPVSSQTSVVLLPNNQSFPCYPLRTIILSGNLSFDAKSNAAYEVESLTTLNPKTILLDLRYIM